MNSSHRDDSPVLITEAQPSLDDQQALRRRKYAIMMASRVPCLVLAAVVFQMWPYLWWLSLVILAISIPLPWMAVLIANDRPVRRSEKVNRFRHSHRALESREHQVIEN
ncbi:DUF3099 domain-containing protein [Saccharopolyspora indica]|uniref:DUF3099 domain-containing protein n=1 Tax=Saccharopolyspora indica TaxID=1229659 RepID=UPI0022EACCE1|nr:DUF3099 domain-containing protein [Saccharopolyspora indica]MDA3649577.1 DUF3099 domain-containing protein [Saccharopolyspora indica]